MTRWSDDSDALFQAERDAAGPSREARARMRAKVRARVGRGVGVAAAATVTATAARNAGATSGALAAGGGAGGTTAATGTAKAALLTLALKIAAPVVLAGALGAAATGVIRARDASPSRAVAVSAVAATPARGAAPAFAPSAPVVRPALAARVVAAEPVPPIAAATAVAPAKRASREATATRVAPVAPSAPPLSALAPPPPDALVAQLAGVGSIEDALRRGDPALALALADDYARAYPRGAFREEAAGARVIALCTIGRTPDAARAAASFAEAHPASLLLPRLDAACGEAHDSITDPQGGGQ